MFAGHVAIGLALKKAEPRVNLGWLIFAAMFIDFLLGVLVLAGVEQIHVPANYADLHYLTYNFPYSHGLAANLIWATLAFFVARTAWPDRGRRTVMGLIVAAAVFSHWVLDFIVHVPELPVLGAASARLGLGLWDHFAAALALELALLGAGLFIYLRTIKPGSRLTRYGVTALAAVVAVPTVGQMFATQAPPAVGAAATWVLETLLLAGIAFWLDRKSGA